MSKFFLLHLLFLCSSVGLTFAWVNHPVLSFYTLQLVGLFVLLYFTLQLFQKRQKTPPSWINFLNNSILTSIVLLLVFSTGGLTSPIFFLIYFLLFGLSWSLGSFSSIVVALALVIFFILSSVFSFEHLASLASLILITPLSVFFGQQYLKVLQQKGEIKILQKIRHKEEKALVQEETDVLFWLGLNFLPSMKQIIDILSQVLADPSLPTSQKQSLEKALETAKKNLETGEYLKEKVDIQTD